MDKKHSVDNETGDSAALMSALDFARLGDGHVAYVKQIDREQARSLFPAVTGLPEGIDLYALVGADGTPLGLSDSRDTAIASAMEIDLQPVSLH